MPALSRLIALALVAAAFAASAAAQDRSPAFSADELINILKPAPRALTRSLSPGTGPAPEPGTAGSGVLPDLKVMFPFNSADLTPDTQRQLDELGRALGSSDLGTFRFELAGHTDALGSDSYNEVLSARRAAAVADYLESRFGIEPQRLEPRGYGKTRLLDDADPANARNRRVEILTLQ